jgi:hypothetical protein
MVLWCFLLWALFAGRTGPLGDDVTYSIVRTEIGLALQLHGVPSLSGGASVFVDRRNHAEPGFHLCGFRPGPVNQFAPYPVEDRLIVLPLGDEAPKVFILGSKGYYPAKRVEPHRLSSDDSARNP